MGKILTGLKSLLIGSIKQIKDKQNELKEANKYLSFEMLDRIREEHEAELTDVEKAVNKK